MDKKITFMQAFTALEKYLRIEYDQGSYKESTFMGTLFRVRGRKENAIIANPKYFDILQQGAQLRNIIVHNEEVAEPTDKFLKKFSDIVTMITKPQKVEQAMIPLSKIKRISSEETVANAIAMMESSGFSKIPVFENGTLIGVFTEKSLYYYMSALPQAVLSPSMKIKEMQAAIDFDGNPARYFAFISRSADVFAAIHMFRRDFQEKNKLEMLFVTHSGKRDESILGILTLPDLEHVIAL